MAVPILLPAFTHGEVAPNTYGRYDVQAIHTSAYTMRNMFPSYKGGAYSRPGTRFVGFSLQFGRAFPPRLIPFQFSINQGLILEFGNFYMRVVLNGAMVLEPPLPISNVTQASPGVVTATASGATAAAPVNTGVLTSYAAGDDVTLSGGTFINPAILNVTTTLLLSCATFAGGSGYAPGDTITLSGGTHTTPAVLTVDTTGVTSIALGGAGTGGAPGSAILTGTTGVGTKFTVSAVINSFGNIQSLGNFTPGSYTVNPTNLIHEPVTGGGLVGAYVGLDMGVQSQHVSTPGNYTVNASNLGQAATSGFGSGATFISPTYGILAVTVLQPGNYSVFPTNPVAQASTTGTGTGALFSMTFAAGGPNGFVTGDWIFIDDVSGMTELNGQTFVIVVTSPTTFQLFDVQGNAVDTTLFPAYISGGTASRVFTLPTIYSEEDLEYLKFTQSADVMTLCLVNQVTGTEYPPQDLERFSDTEWVFTPVVPEPSIGPPAVSYMLPMFPPPPPPPNNPPIDTWYAYVVTAVAPDGTESVAGPVASFGPSVDISATAGSNLVVWTSVPGAITYNIYKAEPSYGLPVPVGALYGYAGSSYGNQFVDTNVVQDFAQVPPLHRNPFARGQIIEARVINGGFDYTSATVAINTATGSGAVIDPVILLGQDGLPGGPISALLIVDPGEGYLPGDTITINGSGSGATGVITIGPETGTYPAVPNYFQQRRVFGFTLNNPDTYFMSQPGAFTNFDTRLPTIATDAITGSPWSLQVNGLQWFILMPAGLAVFTGLSAWLLVGAGSFATNVQPITPSSQVAQPLAFTGCSATLPPMKINYDIIYVTSKGSYYYDLPYQLYALSEPVDLTVLSSHLFDTFTFREHTWAETPFKLIWTVRSDGTLLTCTYLKQQQVQGWARHDTNGFFWSIASVVEPIIANPEVGDLLTQKADAVYVVVERHPGPAVTPPAVTSTLLLGFDGNPVTGADGSPMQVS